MRRRRWNVLSISGLIGPVLFVALGIAAVVIPEVSPVSATHQILTVRLAHPGHGGSWPYVLGADDLGRPLLIRIACGLRTSYMIGICSVLLAGVIGTSLGLIAGYFGSVTDTVIMRFIDLQVAFPALLLAMVIVAIASGGPVVLVIVLAFASWSLFARVVRSAVIRQRATDFIDATIALGASPRRVMFRHLLPNTVPELMGIASFELATIMLAEATLSFLGFGVQPPTVSLGAMLAEGQDYLTIDSWFTTFAGAALALAVVATNTTGAWLERRLDPTWRSSVIQTTGAVDA